MAMKEETSGSRSPLGSMELFKMPNKKTIILFVGILLTIICGSANNILYYKIALPFENYPFFLVIYSSLFSVPVYWFFVVVIMATPRWKHFITPQMKMFPMWKFAILGFLDSLQGILSFFSDSHVPGATQQLLLQLTIPMTMVASVVILKTKYVWGQYLGALVIILGIVVDIFPAFLDPSSELAPDSLFWLAIFLGSTIPFAISYIYKEIIFKDLDMSLFYLMAFDTNFQFLFNLLFSPVDAIPGFGSASSFSDVYINIYYGFLCFFGTNSLPGDDCVGSWFPMIMYAFFNVGINLCLLFLLQQDSAAFMFLAMTITVPIANLCFSSKLIMGSAAVPLSWYDIVALVVIVFGLLLYRFTTPDEVKQDDTEEDVDSSSSSSSDEDEYPSLVYGKKHGKWNSNL